MRNIMIAAAAVAAVATPALAQVNTGSGNGLVAVNVQNVDILKNFLNDSQVSALNNLSVPVTVNVPVGVAATVCGVNANVLASQKKGSDPVTCTAKNGSKALRRTSSAMSARPRYSLRSGSSSSSTDSDTGIASCDRRGVKR